MPPKPSKPIALTLEQRVEVIKKSEKDKLSARKIAEHFGVGRTQIDGILKRKAEVLADYDNNQPSDRKRQRKLTGNEDINILVWKWFQDATARRINVSGPLIKEKTLKFAEDLGIASFKVSNGWLDSCK
ncbi:tigger transposable element-derived protein 4-like [Gigantopelta aegis]|uniref:tigger transposable element-derived protein 4-like n=1 Tax=Gigantopelta aegis TaxID=1735272 RepID=UPI001B88B18D|nr:tigger transposable element-derived protein 4-like [Gigantopelta aegis]